MSEFLYKKNITPKYFKEKIKRGLGSAILILRSVYNIEQYKEIVLWATLNNTCYCNTTEDYRGNYIFEIISYFNDNYYFETELIKKYNAKTNNINDFNHLTNMLYCFAKSGSSMAKDTLYKKYHDLSELVLNSKQQIHLKETPTIEQKMLEEVCIWLTSLDGFDALKKIIVDLKQYFLYNHGKEHFKACWFFENAFRKFSEKRVLKILQKNGIFYEPYDYKSPPEKRYSLQEIIALCNTQLSWQERFDIRKFGRTATNKELLELMQRMIIEKNLDIKANYLGVFEDVSFSSNVLCVRDIIECSKINHKKLKSIAYDILSENACEDVYNYAVGLINSNVDLGYAIELLCKNYKKSDAELLSKSVKKLKISYASFEWHSAFMAVNSLIEENKNAPLELLEYLYEQTLCSDCRWFIVRNIVKRKLQCIERILKECEYDCEYDTRDFAIKIQKKILSPHDSKF